MKNQTHIISEYRARQLRLSIVELFAVTTVIAVLCALGNGGVVVAIFFGITGTICRVLSRTWIGWIAGPFMAMFTGLIGLAIHPYVGIGFGAIGAAVTGWNMGKDRFYREYPHWSTERTVDDDE